MDNPETQATLRTRHGTNEDKKEKNKTKQKQSRRKKNVTQKTKRMSNTVPTDKPGVNQGTRHSIDAPKATLDTPRERFKQENKQNKKTTIDTLKEQYNRQPKPK